MKKALLLLFVAFSGNSFATFLTGNDLYTRYQAYVRSDNGTASREDYFAAYDYMGYVTGVWDTLGSELICPQGSITRVVVKFFWTRRSDGRVMHRRATGRG
ncbi:hypothetical protein AAFM38_26560, partial [Klebsiella pneumoniae]